MTIDFARNDHGTDERRAVNRVLDSDWLASGNENEQFEKEFAAYVGTKYAVCVNSGSSANLLALASLQLPKYARVLTSACGFPATLAPILHLGDNPILVDYDINTHNIDLEQALRELPNVDALIFAHTMGNPVQVDVIVQEAKRLGVKVIEDCCEAVGTTLNGQYVGSFGDVGTYSFYPSHQMTAGGMGGMLVTNDRGIWTRAKEFRDWGKTWNWDEKLGDNKTMYDMDIGLEYPYYRHYCYAQAGYNFKLAEMNAAFGREQLKKLEHFKRVRQLNYECLSEGILGLKEFIDVATVPGADPCWFGFILTLKDGSKLNRNAFGNFLESKGIRHRPFFAGNITQHKPFGPPQAFPVADKLMKDSLFIGCHTKMFKEQCEFIVKEIRDYAHSFNS